MKKLSSFLVGLALTAGTVLAADTNTATSVNIVGFNKIVCASGKFTLSSTAFKSIDGSLLKANDVFGTTQLPLGTRIYSFNQGSNTYKQDVYGEDEIGNLVWSTNIVFDGSMGFWVSVPAQTPASNYVVTVSGEVPMSLLNSNVVNNGYSLLGYPYTASVLWTNTSLAKNAQPGDALYVFNESGAYIRNPLAEDEGGNLVWGFPSMVINPGVGFWFLTTSPAYTNVESRPYNP